MNRAELREFSKVEVERPSISVSDIVNPEKNRTLLYGVTGAFFLHVWLADGRLYRMIIGPMRRIGSFSGKSLPVELLGPGVRVYPESTEYAFARLLAARGVELDFVPIDEERGDKQLADHYPYRGLVIPLKHGKTS